MIEIFSSLMTLLCIIAIFYGAYYVSKMVGGTYQSNVIYGKNIVDIIERKPISKDQSILVIKVSDKVIVLGATSNQISEIASFNADEFEIKEVEKPEVLDFKSTFKEVLNKYTNANKKD